jgi:glyoxylase-like metal-dependent hydrolase (beta-lactamase superfamily II)/ferredoxin
VGQVFNLPQQHLGRTFLSAIGNCMANPAKSLPANVPGPWFVDATCIDCDTCRQLAPRVFGEADGYSFVQAQPQEAQEERTALHALVSCPTGSIGTRGASAAKSALGDFPLLVDGDVYYCGFASPKSFGGSSYFVRHAAGNWLIDSPKFLPQLARKFEALGGVSHIFLTHRDDVADADKYARHFGARRIIHRLELASQPDAEQVVDGSDAVELAPGFLAIPTPGHTAGHLVLLCANRYLFTGDHLAWDRDHHRLMAFRDYCWHSWTEQQRSLARLLDYEFEWVLPGHGQRVYLPAGEMAQKLARLIAALTGLSKSRTV